MKKTFLNLSIALMSVLAFTACDNDDEATVTDGTLTLNIANLEASAANEAYEGWVIVNGAPVSTGTFTVDANGALSQSTFTVKKDDLEAATDFVLSIEPIPDSDPAPSAIKILGGAFSGTSASVSAEHGAALGDAFASISGKYILATPTTTTLDDELSGVWFLDLAGGSPAVGLDLPTLPAGWLYEGWAVIDGTPISTGTFNMVDAADDSGAFSGSDEDGPPFPGEDFVMNAPMGITFPTDLNGATIVISIEPSPDNSTNPFAFKPLIGAVPDGATDHVTYDMTNSTSDTFPSGSVSR